MFFIIAFGVAILATYWTFYRKKYKESKNKDLYLKTHLYQSNLWLFVLIVLSLTLVNIFAPKDVTEVIPDLDISDEVLDLDSLKELKGVNQENFDFHFHYITSFYYEYGGSDAIEWQVKDYYQELLDSGFSDQANFALAYYNLKKDRADSTLTHLELVSDPSIRYHSLLASKAYFSKNDEESGFSELFEEIENEEGAIVLAYEDLKRHLETSQQMELVSSIPELRGYHAYIPFHLKRKVLYLNNQIPAYIITIFQEIFRRIHPVSILAAFLILLTWAYYIKQISLFKSVKIPGMVLFILGGMICSLLTFVISDHFHLRLGFFGDINSISNLFLYSVFGIGAIEEFVKILPLILILISRYNSLDPFEFILYASLSALGFAFVENLLYFDSEYGSIIHGRALTSVVAHMIFSSIIGYGLLSARSGKVNLHPVVAFLLFWFLSALAHGFYDFYLFTELIVFFVMFFLVLLRVWITLVTNALNNSPEFRYSKEINTSKIQFYLAFSLTGIFMFEYVIVGFQQNASIANSNFFSSIFSGSLLIAFIGSKLSSLDLMKGYWGKINFSINPFTDDIIPQNFVGQKISLHSYYEDRGLIEYYPSTVDGVIAKRIVLRKKEPTFFMSHEDPDWFLIKLSTPVSDDLYKKDFALIKFYENRSSLNDREYFRVNLLFIPKEVRFKNRYPFRSEMESIGWVWLEGK